MVEELLTKFGLTSDLAKDTTIISAGGKWTIPAIVKVLNGLGIESRVIHDEDRKDLTDQELAAKSAIHPFKANAKIAAVTGRDKVFQVQDTFEHVLWDQELNEQVKSTDKPYNSWLRVRGYLDGTITLTKTCEATLKEIVQFAFCE